MAEALSEIESKPATRKKERGVEASTVTRMSFL